MQCNAADVTPPQPGVECICHCYGCRSRKHDRQHVPKSILLGRLGCISPLHGDRTSLSHSAKFAADTPASALSRPGNETRNVTSIFHLDFLRALCRLNLASIQIIERPSESMSGGIVPVYLQSITAQGRLRRTQTVGPGNPDQRSLSATGIHIDWPSSASVPPLPPTLP